MKPRIEMGRWIPCHGVSLLMISLILAGCGKNVDVTPVEKIDVTIGGSTVGLTNDQKKTLLSSVMPACEHQPGQHDLKAQITSAIMGAGLSPADISIKVSRTSAGTKNSLDISIKGDRMSVSCASETT
jgi:hypothetical protein